ncbi:unnamed protein product [Rotaria sp. Silwood2]|nr:unnamed protein product [Rotaria sp. Silwood2]CAF4183102.1 unnamed protein product [Rotaria sp. Silwood2]
MFSQGWTNYDSLVHETSTEVTETSRATIAEWIGHCRDVCFVWVDNYMERQGFIGGEGETIEIDEVKIGKRKYNRADEDNRRGGAYRLEICPDNKRDATTLIPLIKKTRSTW